MYDVYQLNNMAAVDMIANPNGSSQYFRSFSFLSLSLSLSPRLLSDKHPRPTFFCNLFPSIICHHSMVIPLVLICMKL